MHVHSDLTGFSKVNDATVTNKKRASSVETSPKKKKARTANKLESVIDPKEKTTFTTENVADVEPRDRRGRVECATGSFAALEQTARKVDAKGIYFNRGTHKFENEIAQWLEQHEEADFEFGEYAHAQLLVAPPRNSCDDSDCEDTSCQTGTPSLAGLEEIKDACKKLVTGFPSSFRDAVAGDANAIARMLVRLCPGVPWLTMRLEIVQHDACWRWHQDFYTCRAIISYIGPGTCTANDNDVRWEQFEKTKQDETNDICVPRECIRQMQTNSVLLMKGDSWPGIRGKGLTHKSPDLRGDYEPPKRLLLKISLNENGPPLGSDDEDEEDGYGEDKADGYDTEDQDSLDWAYVCLILLAMGVFWYCREHILSMFS